MEKKNVKKNDKTTTKKKVTGKVAVTKKSGVGKAAVTKKNGKKGKKNQKKFELSTEKVLLSVFIVLLILVIFLAIVVVKKKNEKVNQLTANLVIPVLKIDGEQNLSINVSNLVNEDDYILKVTNYRNDKINEEEIPYTVTVINNSSSEIEVTKDNSDYNYMIDQEAVIIEEQKLRGKKKQDTYYHVKVTKAKDVKDTDKINIKIES